MVIVLNENAQSMMMQGKIDHDSHWTSLIIKKQNNGIITAYYLDPLGNEAPVDNIIFQEILLNLRASLADGTSPEGVINVFTKNARIQNDGHSCGP